MVSQLGRCTVPHRKSEFDSCATPALLGIFSHWQSSDRRVGMRFHCGWPTNAKRHLGFDAAPYRRRAHESRGVRKFAFDWRQGSRGSGHTILVNSRSPEALISHDSAPMQSTSEAAQFLTIQAFSRKCPIGHALDISFENWTSSLRIYTAAAVGSRIACHLAIP